MRNVQDNFETDQRSFASAFSICMTMPLTYFLCNVCSLIIAHRKGCTLTDI